MFVSVTLKHERAFQADKSKKEIGWFLPASQPRESLWIQHTFGMLSFLSWLGSTLGFENAWKVALMQPYLDITAAYSYCSRAPNISADLYPPPFKLHDLAKATISPHMFKHSGATMQSPPWQHVLCKYINGVSWLCYLTVGTRVVL